MLRPGRERVVMEHLNLYQQSEPCVCGTDRGEHVLNTMWNVEENLDADCVRFTPVEDPAEAERRERM